MRHTTWCLSPQKMIIGFPKTDFSLKLLRPLYLILMANLSGTILKKINLKQLIFNLSKMTLTFPN